MSSHDRPSSAVTQTAPPKPKTKREQFQAERLELWASFLTRFDPLRTRWFDAWGVVADALNAGDMASATAALNVAASVFADLHAVTQRWADDAQRLWRRSKWSIHGRVPHDFEIATGVAYNVTRWAEWVVRNGGLIALVDGVRAKLTSLVGEQRELNRVGRLLSFLAHGGEVAPVITSLDEADLLPGLPSALAVSVVWPPDKTAWPYPTYEQGACSHLWPEFIRLALSMDQSHYVVDALWEEMFHRPDPEDAAGPEDSRAVEAEHPRAEPASANGSFAPRCDGRLLCSPDFGVVRRDEETFTLSPTQREVIRHMVEVWESGPREFTQGELLEACGSTASFLSDVFKRCPAWGTLIVRTAGRKGVYELRLTG